MNYEPLVSILINCYNGEKYLRASIDSIYEQSYQNWEIIFWDNASTDGKSTLSAKNELARNQTLDARSNPEGSGMSGFNVSDGDGGSYQTDSSGTAGAGTAQGSGIYGMEDEYDDPPPTTNDDNNSGGK